MGEQYNELSTILRRVRMRWRAMTALRAWSQAAAAAAAVLLLALMTHRLLSPEGTALVALWSVAALAACASIAWLVAPVRRAPGDRQVARFVEECCPELEDTLVTAVAHREHSPRESDDPRLRLMLTAVVGDALRRARHLDLDRIVSRDGLRRAVMTASIATVALVVLGAFSAGPAGRAAGVFALYVFPERLVLAVTPGDVKMRAGQPLRVTARVPGVSGGVVPVLRFSDGTQWHETRMATEPEGGFAFTFEQVEQPFTYSVTAATARSRDYRVLVVRPPRVERIDLRYEYPSTFGLKPRVEQDSGDIYGPIGTRVLIGVHTDKPIASATLNLGAGRWVRLQQTAQGAEGELVISEDGSYRVALADSDGLSNPGETEYFIRTLEDRPPDVRVIRPASDKQVTPIEEVRIEARADDDFGIAAFDLVYAVRGGPERAVPFRRDGSGMTVNGDRTVYLEDLDVQPGDFVTYYARARDVSRGKRATEARSDIFFLEVKPFDEEFVAAQSQAMGGGGGGGDRSLDDLAEAQKEIIVATWKLDARGRNARGLSQSDIRTVARAQAELRKRAQAAAGQLARAADPRRRVPRPAEPTPPGDPTATDDPMTRAVEAMGKAQQQLEALKTSEALPHEMVALNELLRAQADVRRRQVQRQQNAMGGRGSNRQQQDMSSLFDRELARQQSTNYETPNSSETRDESKEGENALERIRDLARRQDALTRQQQELAKQRERMTEEELRRQLEKLTREQTELRLQAEELARQIQHGQQGQQSSRSQNQQGQQGQSRGQTQGQSRTGPSQQQNAENSRALREAAGEMQSAASDLRRQDPSQASARGNRASEKLRDLEQRMRSAQPDDRHRALGELQLEARQLADAQRQLAADAERQTQARQQNSDAARRHAAEQERLADRTQRLEQSVRQLASVAQGAAEEERKALGEAARDLDRQKLSERMRNAVRRDAASPLDDARGALSPGRRAAASPPEAGQAGVGRGSTNDQRAAAREGQEIAKALDRVAERLGAASGQSVEAQRLSDELSRLRDQREKLNAVDRQLSELRRRGGEAQENQRGQARETQRGGQPQQQEGQQRQGSSQGQQGASGQQGSGEGGRGGEVSRPQDGSQPWREARELVDELGHESGVGGTPEMERFNPGISAPGTEAWKQDFAKWEELKKQIALALERAETSMASQLRAQEAKDRLNAGGAQAVPEQYRRMVDRYYRALAARKR